MRAGDRWPRLVVAEGPRRGADGTAAPRGLPMNGGRPGEVDLVRLALRATGRARVRVRGTSMLPTIRLGAEVTIERCPLAEVRAGEVVAFVTAGGVVVHRVVERCQYRLLTLGDNLPLFDPPVTADRLLGRVVASPAPRRRPPPGPRTVIRDGPRRPSRDLVHDLMRDLGRDPARSDPARLAVWCAGRPPAGATAALAAVGVPLWLADDPAGAARAHAGRAGLVIGVSAAGALPAEAIGDALAASPGGGCAVLVGFEYGGASGAGQCLPPRAADVHIRLGRPLRPLSLAESLRAVAAAVHRYGRRPGPFDSVAERAR